MNATDPSKRVPKSLGTDANLVGTYTLTDVAVGLFPAVLVVLFLQVVLPSSLSIGGFPVQALTLPLAGVAVAIGAVFVYLTPTYTTSFNWLGTFLKFQWGDKELAHKATKSHTQIKRVHPQEGAIERTDGTFIGMVQVDPPSMALATDEEWRTAAEAFQDFCNIVVEFPIQIYSTTQAFPVEEHLARYEARLDDPDVQANPRLAELIEQYVEWYASELEERRMTIRDHYVIVTVAPDEVRFERESLLQQLAALPLLGSVIQTWFAPRREAQRDAMFDALAERRRRIETGLREIEGCDARRVEVGEATQLVGEFWAGQSLEYGDMERILRTRPVVGRKT